MEDNDIELDEEVNNEVETAVPDGVIRLRSQDLEFGEAALGSKDGRYTIANLCELDPTLSAKDTTRALREFFYLSLRPRAKMVPSNPARLPELKTDLVSAHIQGRTIAPELTAAIKPGDGL